MRRVAIAAAVIAGGAVLAGPALGRQGAAGQPRATGSRALLAPAPAKAGIQLTQAPMTIHDAQGRVLVDVYAREGTALSAVKSSAEQAGLNTVTQSADQQALEGFVAVSDIKALAKASGVASVSQALKPHTWVGAATSQGVAAERVDKVPKGIDGRGITVGALSDSFDTRDDVHRRRRADRPCRRRHPHRRPPAGGRDVLQDAQGGADEGRAMLQIVHDIAPKAKECFATAEGGDLNFANNIRALADRNGAVQGERDRRRRRLLRRAVLQPRPDLRRRRRRRAPRASTTSLAPATAPRSRPTPHRCGSSRPGRRTRATSSSPACRRRCTRAASRTSTRAHGRTSRRISCSARTRRPATAAVTASSTSSGTTRSIRTARRSAPR